MGQATGAAVTSPRQALAARILGLRSPAGRGAPLQARDIAYDAARSRVTIDLAGVADLAGAGWEVRLELSERDDTRPAYARTSHLDISFRGTSLPPLAARLVAHLTRRLARVSMQTLTSLIEALPPSTAASTAERDATDAQDDPIDLHRGLHETWGHPDRWRIFLLSSELKRARDSAVRVDLPWVSIEHGDFECQFVGIGDFLVLPWRSPWLRGPHAPARSTDEAERHARSRGLPGHAALNLVTDLHDMDVIGGGTDRLAELLEELRGCERDPPELIQLNCTCVPLMNGDDVDHLVARERERATFPIIYKAQRDVHPYGAHITAMREALLAEPRPEADPTAVNLVGLPEGAGLDDLRGHLAAVGITVNRAVVPRMAPSMMAGYRRATAQIMLENSDWQAMVDYCFADLAPMRTLRPPSPFGLARSIAWLEAVAGALTARPDVAARARRALAALSARLGAELAPLVDAAAARGFGIVIEPADLPRLTQPARLFGLPLLPLVEELGWRPRVAVFAGGADADARADLDADARADLEASLAATLDDPAHLDVRWFHTPDELGDWLREEALTLIYSDYRYDHRITAAGKTPVSSHAFELGPEGALRSARRLLRLGRSTFYRRCGRHLARPRPRPNPDHCALELD